MIYFDNSATTFVKDEVIEEMIKYMKKEYINVDSSYSSNIIKKINEKKKILKTRLGLDEKNFIFTSGGAEANKIALEGVMKKYKQGHFLISKIEHSSIIFNANELKNLGYDFDYISVDEFGNIDIENLKSLIREDTKLISIIAVNNEIGTIQDIEKISKIIKNKDKEIVFHIDFVQGLNHIDIDFSKIDIDLLSISSHKIHGPKGIGALYIKENLKLKPIYFGENKYNNYLNRTFPTELVMGFLKAISLFNKEDLEKLRCLKEYFLKNLNDISNIYVNSPNNSSPSIINVSFIGIKAEILQNYLSSNKIYVSTSSACSSNKKDSHVLRALNISKDRIESGIRISFNTFNTFEEIDIFFEKLKIILNLVRSVK